MEFIRISAAAYTYVQYPPMHRIIPLRTRVLEVLQELSLEVDDA
jgi:hypothetical protein